MTLQNDIRNFLTGPFAGRFLLTKNEADAAAFAGNEDEMYVLATNNEKTQKLVFRRPRGNIYADELRQLQPRYYEIYDDEIMVLGIDFRFLI